MSTTQPTTPARSAAALAGLRLADADLLDLAGRGFVSAEFRGRRGPYFKLRWRRGGRQHVRYIGRDPLRAEQVCAALAELQAPRREARRLSRVLADARRPLRRAKEELTACASAQGAHYHGYTLRRTRRAPAPPAPA